MKLKAKIVEVDGIKYVEDPDLHCADCLTRPSTIAVRNRDGLITGFFVTGIHLSKCRYFK